MADKIYIYKIYDSPFFQHRVLHPKFVEVDDLIYLKGTKPFLKISGNFRSVHLK